MSTPSRAGQAFGRRASFWVAAAVAAHTLWTSAAPALSYPLYAARWHLTATTTAGIFAVYPVAVVLALLVFGNLSDHVGRRALLLAGVGASLAGVALFAVAPGVHWLFAGRALMGLGVGLSAGPATAALVDFSAPGQQARANVVATAATAAGMGLATLLGGALIQYAPWPLHLNFIVLLVVLAAVLGAVWFLPRPAPAAPGVRWRPGALGVPRALRRVFATSATAVTAAYALGPVMLSLGAQIAHDLVGSTNALVNGAVLALFALASALVALVARRLPGARSVVLGGLVTAFALVLMVLAARDRSLAQFLASAVLAGAGYSLLFMGGLTLINAAAAPEHRGGTISAIYLIGYVLMGAIAMALGKAATAWGLAAALGLAAAGIGLLALAAALLAALPAQAPATLPRRQVASGL